MRKFVIGIDGGATHTRAIVSDLDGKILTQGTSGSAHFQMLGVEPVAKTIVELIQKVLDDVGADISDVEIIVIGLTGAGRETDRKKIYTAIINCAQEINLELPEVVIETDARIALESAFCGKPGIVLIAGTGSVMFAKDVDGKIHRVGGWGKFIGDEGSAFVIGREALRACAKFIDGRGKKTMLIDEILREFNLNDLMEVVPKIYTGEFDLAKVAPVVMRCAERGDEIAIEILKSACDELLLHIEAMLKKGNFGEKVNIALLGGVLENENFLSKMLRSKIKEKFKNVVIKEMTFPPAYGAVLLGLEMIKTKMTS